MVEPEDVILAENDARARPEKDGLGDLAAVDVNEGGLFGDEGDDALVILEDAVLAENVRAAELNVLGYVGLGAAEAGQAHLEIVDEALGHEGVLVQVHQVGRLLGREHPDGHAVLLDRYAHLREDRLSLQPDRFRAFQLLLPRFVQFYAR